MAKKNLSLKAGNGKAKAPKEKTKVQLARELERDCKKELKQQAKGYDKKLKEMSSMGFEDFRAAAIDDLRKIQKALHGIYGSAINLAIHEGEQRDMMLKALSKGLKDRDKDIEESFRIMAKRVGTVGYFLFLLWVRSMTQFDGRIPSYKSRKDTAETLGLDWDGMVERVHKRNDFGTEAMPA